MQNDGINEHGVWAGEVILLVLFYFKDDVHNKICLCFFCKLKCLSLRSINGFLKHKDLA
jgi:hypothetical protein